MRSSLCQFQDNFAQALLVPEMDAKSGIAAELTTEIAALVCQPGFAVYRNTVMKGCIDALQANYPSVTRLVGEEWLRAAAAIYVRMQPPQDARLLYYGADFADFLSRFPPATDLPYLPDVARLDRFWTESHAACDEAPLDPAAIASLSPEALTGIVLHPHASARWAWFDNNPIYTIWRRNRQPLTDDTQIDWRGEGALLLRPHQAVEWLPLDAGGCAFLDACMHSRPLAEAAQAALAVEAHTDLAQLLATLLGAGAFGSLSRLNP